MPRHRSARYLILVVGLVGGLTIACQRTTPSATPTSSSSAATSSPPTAATPRATRTTAPTTTTAALVLGPDGIGMLRLGMSRGAAEATGLVEPFQNQPIAEKCFLSRLKSAPAEIGRVVYSDTFGVAIVEAYEGVQTPEGIAIGSPVDAVDQAYPGWRQNGVFGARGYASVPGNNALVYRIGFADGKTVTELSLQYLHQDCWE